MTKRDALKRAQQEADRLPGGSDYRRFVLLDNAITVFLSTQTKPCPVHTPWTDEEIERGGPVRSGLCTCIHSLREDDDDE